MRPRHLWALGFTAATTPALCAEIAAVHRHHWLVEGAFWSEAFPRMAGLAWALLLGLTLAGWASAQPLRLRPNPQRVTLNALWGASGGALATLAAAPAWFWVSQLGITGLVSVALKGGLIVTLTGGLSGAASAWLPAPVAALLGAALTALMSWGLF